jgi:hypothetical protein
MTASDRAAVDASGLRELPGEDALTRDTRLSVPSRGELSGDGPTHCGCRLCCSPRRVRAPRRGSTVATRASTAFRHVVLTG